MRCPFCGDETNKVVDTRLVRDGEEIRRRRECLECTRRFTTRERVEMLFPRLIKRDERREEYDRKKLSLGIERACQKRPISTEDVEQIVDRLERRLQETGEKEVTSSFLGDWTMEELTAVDPLAAVRFASVFRGFQQADDYTAFFGALDAASGDPKKGDD